MCKGSSTSSSDPNSKDRCSKPPKDKTSLRLPFNVITLLDSLDEVLAAALEMSQAPRGRPARVAKMKFGKMLAAFLQQLESEQHLLPLTQGLILNLINR